MQAIQRIFVTTFLVALCLLTTQPVRAELVATSGGTNFATLTPLRNGVSAITFVWPLEPLTQDRIIALRASLKSVLSGGTSSRSAFEIDTFLSLKGIDQNISINGQNLVLTVSSSNEDFAETLAHLESVLLEANYSKGWYERTLEEIRLNPSSITARSSDVLHEVFHFLDYAKADKPVVGDNGTFQFGRPSQLILRSGDEDAERRAVELVHKLPKAKWKLPFAKWAAALVDKETRPFALPTGVIHFADPDASEMLILFVKAVEFGDENDQIGANLLMDYIGGNSGSEMFRVIRQELRAAYAPQSNFIVTNKNRAILSMSATVAAEKWPEIHGTIEQIYQTVRAGELNREGLEVQLERFKGAYSNYLYYDPVWGVMQYLYEYPEGADGTIELPILVALEMASPKNIMANSKAHLPPLEDFLLILIGGGPAPVDALTSKGYCALTKNTPLQECLEVLSKQIN